MKRGFTLLELIIVIIIIGILATLGFTQYARLIEKARGAEAKTILGDLRKLAVAYRLEQGTVTGVPSASLGLGTATGDIPSGCASSHYFFYAASCTDPSCTFTATRCTALGKTPQAATAGTLNLTSDFSTGIDSWGGSGGY